MRELESVTQLIDFIRREGNETLAFPEASRFPVRFILIKGLNTWQEILNELLAEVDEVIRLSSFCTGDDVFPQLQKLFSLLESNSGRKVLVLPLAECLRFVDNFRNILRKLAEWQDVGKGRIYFPLFEISDIFEQEMKMVTRYKAKILPEVLSVKGNGNVDVTVTPFETRSILYKPIKGIKSYIKNWEGGGESQLCLVTEHAPFFNERIGSFEVNVYRDAFELIKKKVTDLPLLKKEWGSAKQWNYLAKEVNGKETFNELAAKLLNVKSFLPEQLFLIWENIDENKRWLLWLWSKTGVHGNTLLSLVLKNSNNVSCLKEDLINVAFNNDLNLNLLKERKILVGKLKVKEMPSTFWKFLDGLPDPLEKLKSFTGLTKKEKEEIVLVIKELLEKGKDYESWWPYLEMVYPQLASYLTPFPFEDDFIKEYLQLYINSRVMDYPVEKLLGMGREAAEIKTIWNYPTRDGLIEKFDTKNTVKFWVDGMGLEWLGLLKDVLRQNEDIKMTVDIARTNLPTTTAFNKSWEKENVIERYLDKFAHDYDYKFPRTLVEEIALVEKIAAKAIEISKEHKEVIITSDHGLTRFASYGGKVKPPEGAQVHEKGRYAILKDSPEEVTFYNPKWLTDGDKIVLAVHEKFEGAGGYIGEIHGGATLEECLVPVVRVRKVTKTASKPKFEITNTNIKLSAKGEGQLIVEIAASVEKIWLRLSGQLYKGSLKGPKTWVILLKGLSAGIYQGVLEFENGPLGEVKFNAYKGIVFEDLGL